MATFSNDYHNATQSVAYRARQGHIAFYISQGVSLISYKKNGSRNTDPRLFAWAKTSKEKKGEKGEKSTAAVAAVARRRQDRSERAVFVKAEQKRDDDGQSTAAKHVRAEEPVFRAENKQSNQNPKGRVTR